MDIDTPAHLRAMQKFRAALNFVSDRMVRVDAADFSTSTTLDEFDGPGTILVEYQDAGLWVSVRMTEAKSILPPGRRPMVASYTVGYYMYHAATRWEPSEIEDVELGTYDRAEAAVASLVSWVALNVARECLARGM